MMEETNNDERKDTKLEASTMCFSIFSYNETAIVIAELVMSTRTTAGPRGDPDRSFLQNMGLI
jgi:hypothetical protein